VESEGEAGSAASPEIAASLVDVERALLEEHVRGLGKPGRIGKHLGEQELDVGVRSRIDELRREGVRAEPGRDTSRGTDGA
jgi:hypothetical protein